MGKEVKECITHAFPCSPRNSVKVFKIRKVSMIVGFLRKQQMTEQHTSGHRDNLYGQGTEESVL